MRDTPSVLLYIYSPSQFGSLLWSILQLLRPGRECLSLREEYLNLIRGFGTPRGRRINR
jgi:hypothetical protein